MEQTLLILLLCSIILIIILAVILKKRNQKLEETVISKHEIEVARKEELKNYFKEEWDREEKTLTDKFKVKTDGLDKEWQTRFQLHQSQLSNLDNEIKGLEKILKEKEKHYEEVNQDLEAYRKKQIEEIENSAKMYMEHKHHLIEESIDKYRLIKIDEANSQLEQKQLYLNNLEEQINKIQNELEEERTKRAAINEEIRRQREVEEQQDFYRIQLDPNDKDDVEILRSVAPRLRHPEAINKVIWTGYYQKPLAELRKRLLPNGDVSGVYKITRLKTNEIYIGQTTSVDKRWQEHVKSALGVGTLASSQLHRVMASDGCENFTFELLEAVPKDKLRERESYYIDFYDSKTYGLNSVTGDKK